MFWTPAVSCRFARCARRASTPFVWLLVLFSIVAERCAGRIIFQCFYSVVWSFGKKLHTIVTIKSCRKLMWWKIIRRSQKHSEKSIFWCKYLHLLPFLRGICRPAWQPHLVWILDFAPPPWLVSNLESLSIETSEYNWHFHPVSSLVGHTSFEYAKFEIGLSELFSKPHSSRSHVLNWNSPQSYRWVPVNLNVLNLNSP